MNFSNANNHIIAPSEQEGARLDFFLAHSKGFKTLVGKKLSRSQIVRGIKNDGVVIQNRPAKPGYTLSINEILEILPEKFKTEEETLLPEPNLPITVIEENPNFLVIDKPAGIQVHPSVTQKTGTVANWIIPRYPEIKTVGDPLRPGIVHRLDKDTSGLLLIARTKKSFTAIKKLFKNHLVKKRYLALVSGIPQEKSGTITVPIARSTRGDRQSAAFPGRRVKGIIRAAETQYRVLETFENTSLVEAEPKTGRTHQIRVHLASIGHPVLGDTLYVSKTSKAFVLLPTRYPVLRGSDAGRSPRHLLHATFLNFALFGQNYTFESPLPQDFAKFLAIYKHTNPE